jgi:homoserine kinase
MDSWSKPQIERMKIGGNIQCLEFLSKRGVGVYRSIREKYDTPAAELYQQVLKARVEGRPEPTKLPPPRRQTTTKTTAQMKKTITGFGSSAHPSIIRMEKQRKLGVGLGISSVAAIVAWGVSKRKLQQTAVNE